MEKPDVLEMQFDLRLEMDLDCKLEYELLKHFNQIYLFLDFNLTLNRLERLDMCHRKLGRI